MIEIDVQELRLSQRDLSTKGYYVYKNLLDKETCKAAIEEINSYLDKNDVEINYSNSESRIWESENKLSFCKEFKKFSDSLYKDIFNLQADSSVLAIKNTALKPSLEATKSRWHADSFFKQYKLFLFLEEVGIDNGPLEYLKESKSYIYKIRNINKYFKVKGLFNNEARAYSEIQDNFLPNKIKSFAVDQGSLLVINTSAIHRARPCERGERFALTAYF